MFIKCSKKELLDLIDANKEAVAAMNRLDKIRLVMRVFDFGLKDAKDLVDHSECYTTTKMLAMKALGLETPEKTSKKILYLNKGSLPE